MSCYYFFVTCSAGAPMLKYSVTSSSRLYSSPTPPVSIMVSSPTWATRAQNIQRKISKTKKTMLKVTLMEQWLYRGSSRENFSVVSRLPGNKKIAFTWKLKKKHRWQQLGLGQWLDCACNTMTPNQMNQSIPPPSERDMSSVVAVESTPPTRSILLLTTALVWYLQSKNDIRSILFSLTSYFSKAINRVATQF